MRLGTDLLKEGAAHVSEHDDLTVGGGVVLHELWSCDVLDAVSEHRPGWGWGVRVRMREREREGLGLGVKLG